MKPNDIKAHIMRAGTSQLAIAEYLGVTSQAVGRVISGHMRSQRIEAELAKVCGQPVFDTPTKSGRSKSVWTGQVATPAYEGIERRGVERRRSEDRRVAATTKVSQPQA